MTNERLAELRRPLRGKRGRFVEEYIKDGNGTAAAIRAGIPEKGASVQASRFLREPEVLAYRDALIEAEAAAIGVSKDSLIVKSERVYQKCMAGDNPQGAAKALELQGKLIGALTEKREIEPGNAFTVNIQTLGDGADDTH
ncbi:MAG: terminase small subunit [Clostridia bacterium]|nr:terminase small subunit [Clostridia bacterium]